MLWLYLHFPQLTLDHLERGHESARPAVIGSGHPPRVTQANQAALAAGIQPGDSLPRAQTLAPELAVHEDPGGEKCRSILMERARWAYGYTDRITPHPPDGLMLEVHTVLRLHRGLENLYRRLLEQLRQQGFTVLASCGDTPALARALAHSGQALCTDRPERFDQARRQLPLCHGGFEPAVSKRLARMGLHCLGDLDKLPRQALARRLGPEAFLQWQRLHGQAPDPQPTFKPPGRFHQRLDLSQEVEHTGALRFPLHRLLGDLEDFLRQRQESTDRLHLLLHHRARRPTRLTLETAASTQDRADLESLFQLRMERLALEAPVIALSLATKRLLGRAAAAGDLFGAHQQGQQAAESLLDQLRARLGSESVYRLQPNEDHRPEKAWQPSDTGASRARVHSPPDRPLWLLTPPRPLSSPPRQLLSGPERLLGGWWDGQRIERDYFVAQLEEGSRAWIFRTPENDWFIHGWFA